MTPDTLLSDVVVLEFAHVLAGPYAAQVLGSLGATVTKVEQPGGDVTRKLGPQLPDGSSGMYRSVNRFKRIVCLDLDRADDRERMHELARSADVFISNFDVDFLHRYELDFAHLSKRNRSVIYALISAFGTGGPLGTDALAQAAAGLTSVTGPAQGPGVRAGASVVDIATGVWTVSAVLAALNERRRSRQAHLIEVNLRDVALALQVANVPMHSLEPGRIARRGNHSPVTCTPEFKAMDGIVAVTLLNDRHWRNFCGALGRSDLLEDARFATNEDRRRAQGELEDCLAGTFIRATRSEWVAKLRSARVPCAAEQSYDELLRDPLLRLSGVLYDEVHAGRSMTQVASPLKFTKA